MVNNTQISTDQGSWNRDRIELIKRTFFMGSTDDELQLGIATAQRLGLSPEGRQIFFVKRSTWDASSGTKKDVMSIQISIDGYRLVAERTGLYQGQLGPQWCGADGKWLECWLSKTPPVASRVAVLKKGFTEPMWAVAHWDEYVQTGKGGEPTAMWKKMPRLMLAKCAESLALRKAFPNELSGTYTQEEMDQSTNTFDATPVAAPATKLQAAPAPLPVGPRAATPPMMSRVEKMVVSFDKFKISRLMLEDVCGGRKLDHLNEEDFKVLQNLYAEVLSGKITAQSLADELYPLEAVQPETPTELVPTDGNIQL